MTEVHHGLIGIRPHHVFGEMHTDDMRERACSMLIPHPCAFSGGTSAIEALLLVALVKISDANRLFEFGTYMGGSTVLLAENSNDAAEVFTLDLPEDVAPMSVVGLSAAFGSSSHATEDNFLSAKSTTHGPVIAQGFYQDAPSKKITFLRGDSKTVDLHAYDRSIDMSWIDGGHDYMTVKSDTANGLRMANPKNENAVIAWHDFDNQNHQGVGRYLRELGEDRFIYHVGDTMLAFCFPNAQEKRFGDTRV